MELEKLIILINFIRIFFLCWLISVNFFYFLLSKKFKGYYLLLLIDEDLSYIDNLL